MPILNRDDFFASLHRMIGDRTDEDSIKFLEDMSDTYNDMEKRLNGDGEDWKQKFIDNDNAWKERYRHRFMSGVSGVPPTSPESPAEKQREDITITDLFSETKRN